MFVTTKFWCPKCGRQGLLKRKEGSMFLYCTECRRELLIILDPIIKEGEDETRH